MLKPCTKQVLSLSGNKFVKLRLQSFARLARTESENVRRFSPCAAAVPGRLIAPIAGGPVRPSTVRFAWTSAVAREVCFDRALNLTLCTTSNRFLSTSTSRLGAGAESTSDKTPDAGKKESAILAPHFRTLLKKSGTEPGELEHPKAQAAAGDERKEDDDDQGQYLLPHPIWSDTELYQVEVTHKKPNGFVDWLAYSCVQTLRFGFDTLSGYTRGVRSEKKWLIRIIFLETVAGVPGMVAAMTRHLRSLRRMQRDHGWIHTLLEEAENERMHLMTALELRKPGKLFTMGVLFTQGIFVNMFFVAYMCSPRFCHRFVGYLEEEAVITYTKLLKDMDDGRLVKWSNMAAPDLAVRYWKLKPDAMMRDMVLAIRADEAHHREVNHSLSDLKPDQSNPYPPGA